MQYKLISDNPFNQLLDIMKNIILADFNVPQDWAFSKELSKDNTKWEVRCCKSNTKFHHTKIGNLLRYFLYFAFPLLIIPIRKRYNYIVGWQQFYAINMAFWLRLLHLKRKNKIIIMTFIYKRKEGILGNIYHKYIHYSITNKHIKNIICHSQNEVKYYTDLFGLPKDIVRFIPLGIDVMKIADEPNNDNSSSFIFSTGRSNRNYIFLTTALSDTAYTLIIACEDNIQGNEHTEIIHNCYGNQMLNILKRSYCVCIPLEKPDISSGQLVVLQAMQLGKPIIITRTDSIADYIINNYNGFIIGNDKKELLEKLSLLYSNPNIYRTMSLNCISYFNNNFTLDRMAQNLSNIININ